MAACDHAAELLIRLLIAQKKHRDAPELTKCTYSYLMKHNGLDDKDEIALGFRLALLMSNRGENRCQDPDINKEMLLLSQEILGEVFAICDKENIDLVPLQLSELNDLICLVGEQKDYTRLLVRFPLHKGIICFANVLQSLHTTVWQSRGGQRS